jgi:hypothetical protein
VDHRDVKPSNILVDTQGQVKLADFGLAKLVDAGAGPALTRSTAVFGTPQYMAPEQWRGSGAVDHRADIYSAGVVLYEMLTGQLPIGHFDPPSQRPGVPHGLDGVVQRALAQQPERRYQAAREVRTDLELQGRTAPRRAPAEPRRRPPRLAPEPLFGIGLWAVAFVCTRLILREFVQRELAATQDRAEAMRAAAERAARGGGVPPGYGLDPTAEPALSLASHLGAAAVAWLLLGSVLGFAGLRRIRISGGRSYGVGLAVLVAYLPLLLGLNVALAVPIDAIADRDLRLAMTFVAVLVLGAADLWFLARETRRQRALCAAGETLGGRGWVWAGAALGMLALATTLGPAIVRLPPGPPVGTESARPLRAGDLLGVGRAEVLDLLGAPRTIRVSSAGQDWAYCGPDGVERPDALSLQNGRVVAAADPDLVLQSDGPHGIPCLGQALEDLIRLLGPPLERSVGALVANYRFSGGWRVTVHDGVVVGLPRTRD